MVTYEEKRLEAHRRITLRITMLERRIEEMRLARDAVTIGELLVPEGMLDIVLGMYDREGQPIVQEQG